MAERVDPAERLLDLVIALTHARRLTKAEIRRRVRGYDAGSVSDDTFQRMFERDKETLRELGIPLVTDTSPAHGDDFGYRIDTADYELPPVDLTPAEVGVLSLAAELWGDASLRGTAARGMTKLLAVGPAPDPDATAGVAFRLRVPDEAIATILAAIRDRAPLRFTYRAASTGEVRRRLVEPWRLVNQDRGWYLIGRDRDRGEPRAFRLSRIEGAIRRAGDGGAFRLPDRIDPGILARARGPAGHARLAVLPERGAALRARAVGPADATGDRDLLEVPFTDREAFAEELAGYASAVVVLAPAELRAAVVRRLRAVAALGGGPGHA